MLEFDPNDNSAVLIIDMQNDSVRPDGALPAEGALNIIDTIRELLELARKNNIPIIYITHIHRKDLSDFGIAHYFEPPSVIEGTDGAEIIEELTPQKEDIIVTKTRYDGFFQTELDSILRQKKITNLIVSGVLTDGCVLGTVQHARSLDYKVCLLEDCTAGTTHEKHVAALDILSTYCVRVANLEETIDMFALKR
ncbi:cysteine hydrolase family protein [Virgibacillus sp. W0430]|uniref:cysteine hydrolase family protein n=1 Tax=Virgibacillus sp. W0430 TaxID=3391580 RepID=UPI003F47EDFB